jgi:hypothetical protein
MACLLVLPVLSLVSCAKKEEEKPPTPTGAVIVGKAVLSGEKDFSGITVSIEALGVSTTTDASGSFKLSGLTEGVWKVKFEKEGFVVKEVELTVTGTGTVDMGTVELVKPSKITGKVTLEGADDHSGILVVLQDTMFQAKTASDGSFEIGGLSEGSYVLVASKEGWEQKAIDVSVGVSEEVDIGELLLPKIKVPGLPSGAKLLCYYDFEKDPIGQVPAGWEHLPGGASGQPNGVVDVDPTNPKNKVFYVARISDEPLYATGDPGWKDYVMEWDWYIIHDSYIACVFRVKDSDNFYQVSSRQGRAEVHFYKRQAGSWTAIHTSPGQYQMPLNKWFRCQLTVKGSEFSLKIKERDDPTPFDKLGVVLEGSDGTFTEGRVGVHGSDYVDNFLVYIPKGW